MFQPKRIGDDEFIDGGVVSPTHADLAGDAGATTVVVSSPMTRPSRRLLARHARRRLDAETAALRSAGVDVVVVQPTEELMRVADGFPRRRPHAAGDIAWQARVDALAAVERAGV
jgi:predicted acylesterase/phospholipase RssA